MTNTDSAKTAATLYEVSFDNDEMQGVMHKTEQAVSHGSVMIAFPGNGFNPHDLGYMLDKGVLQMAGKLKKYLKIGNVDDAMIKKTPFYVVCYSTPKDFSDEDARILLYKKHGRTNMSEEVSRGKDGFSAEEQNPEYIDSLYEKIIAPRISRLNGKVKIDAETAAKNMAEVVIFAHCHGAYTALKLEEVMRDKMKKLGYDTGDILKVQQQITVVAYAPACPLGVSKMNMVSFKSLNDTALEENYNNAAVYASIRMGDDRSHWVDTHLLQKQTSENEPFDFKLSFYPDRQGNVFVIKQKSNYDDIMTLGSDGVYFPSRNEIESREHNNTGAGETEDSKVMFKLMTNALANALLHSQEQSGQQSLLPALTVRELVIGTKTYREDLQIFEQACQAGAEQGKKIAKHIHQLLVEQNQQK